MRKNIIFILALLMLTTTMAFAANNGGPNKELPKDILVIEQTLELGVITINAIDLSNNELILIIYRYDLKPGRTRVDYTPLVLLEVKRTGMKADPGHYFNRQ